MQNKDFYNDKNIIITPNKIIYIHDNIVEEKQLKLNLNEIRKQIKDIGFVKPYTNDTYDLYYSKKLENYGLPYMNFIYYLSFFNNLKIFDFDSFLNAYIKTYCLQTENKMLYIKPEFNDEYFEFTKEQLTGRIFRAYNSFHRELELFFQFKQYKNIYIEYDFQKDLNGIDLNLKYKNFSFQIASYISTEKSYKWKQIKDDFRHENENLINMIAKIKGEDKNCFSYNGVFLYAGWYVKQKLEEIKNKVNDILKN